MLAKAFESAQVSSVILSKVVTTRTTNLLNKLISIFHSFSKETSVEIVMK